MPADHSAWRIRPTLLALEDRVTPGAGDLDPTFGAGGTVTVPFDLGGFNDDRANAIALQPDGRIVLAGSVTTAAGGTDFAAVRLNADGSLDTTFGTGGKVVVPFDLGGNMDDKAHAMVIQPDDKIVLAGQAVTGTVTDPNGFLTPTSDFAVVRLNPDGSLDSTFGTGGKLTILFDLGGNNGDVAHAVALQPDGKIVLAGEVDTGTFFDLFFRLTSDFAAARLNPDGSLDTTFGTGGRAMVAFDVGYTQADGARAVEVLPDGKIVLAGSAVTGSEIIGAGFIIGSHDFAVARLLPDGTLDLSFGTDGKVTVDFSDSETNEVTSRSSDLAIQADGRIVLAGTRFVSVGNAHQPLVSGDFAAARLNADGALDPSFGTGGTVTVGFGTDFENQEEAHALALQPDGKFILAGVHNARFEQGGNGMAAIRLLADGSLDPSFGAGGKVTVTGVDAALALVLQPDGKIVLAGSSGGDFAAARLLGVPVAQTALIGGRPDGSAVVLNPVSGEYQTGDAIAFFPDFAGTVRTATADVTGDGVPDLIGGAGPGGGPRVRVIDGANGASVADFFPYETSFIGGVYVAAADLDGDGKAEIVVTPDQGGGPVVAVFDGTGNERGRFFGIEDPDFRGGARPALGDVNGDGVADLIVSAGFLGGPRIAVFDGTTILSGGPVKLRSDFFAFEDTLRNGAFVAAGDVNGDGFADIAFGAGPGGAPRLRLFDGKSLLSAGTFTDPGEVTGSQLANFFASDSSLRGGVRLSLKDAGADGTADLVTGSGEGEASRVLVFQTANLLANPSPTADQELDPFGAVLADGVFIG